MRTHDPEYQRLLANERARFVRQQQREADWNDGLASDLSTLAATIIGLLTLFALT